MVIKTIRCCHTSKQLRIDHTIMRAMGGAPLVCPHERNCPLWHGPPCVRHKCVKRSVVGRLLLQDARVEKQALHVAAAEGGAASSAASCSVSWVLPADSCRTGRGSEARWARPGQDHRSMVQEYVATEPLRFPRWCQPRWYAHAEHSNAMTMRSIALERPVAASVPSAGRVRDDLQRRSRNRQPMQLRSAATSLRLEFAIEVTGNQYLHRLRARS